MSQPRTGQADLRAMQSGADDGLHRIRFPAKVKERPFCSVRLLPLSREREIAPEHIAGGGRHDDGLKRGHVFGKTYAPGNGAGPISFVGAIPDFGGCEAENGPAADGDEVTTQ